MCGIAGCIDYSKNTHIGSIEKMIGSMFHRGPDDKGSKVFQTSTANIAIGQTRLSIIDLSKKAHQPMQYKHLHVVFNGEIYNFNEIKQELKSLGHKFSSNSDTEVLLHATYEWGDQAVNKFIGMFAYCIYDSEKEIITIIRDRAGVKPLFYYYQNSLFLFGSELKALMSNPGFKKEIEPKVMPLFFQYGYIPSPHTIFKNCFKLNPGHKLRFNLRSKEITIEKYWDATAFYKKPKLELSFPEAKEATFQFLISACDYRMVADVPVGVFLSGGYDSTAVTAILQTQRTEKIKTFTIGFEEGNNEAPFAKETAKLLGTDHTEYICTTKEAQEIISELPFFYDEPFGDSSAIPTTLVSQLARKTVTVALSADAGDEVYCGYRSYFKLQKFLNLLNKVPKNLKPLFNGLGDEKTALLPFVSESAKHKMQSFFRALNRNDTKQARDLFQFMNEKPNNYINRFFKAPQPSFNSPYQINLDGFQHPLEIAMAIDYQSYLPNDILTKVDRAAMSVSLEAREPLVDHRLLEFSAQLPINYKYDGVTGKRILKSIVHDYVPQKMMERPKTGFSLPIISWLRKDLSFLVEEYLNKEALKWSGIFNENFVASEVLRFKNRKMHYSPLIWYLLMFQMWYKKWMIDRV